MDVLFINDQQLISKIPSIATKNIIVIVVQFQVYERLLVFVRQSLNNGRSKCLTVISKNFLLVNYYNYQLREKYSKLSLLLMFIFFVAQINFHCIVSTDSPLSKSKLREQAFCEGLACIVNWSLNIFLLIRYVIIVDSGVVGLTVLIKCK